MTTSFFKVRHEDRTRVREPKSLAGWVRNGFSEFVGTLMLSLLLAGATMVAYTWRNTGSGADDLRTLGHYLINPAVDGIYAGFIAVGLVVVIFDRWSCDLNPSVTIYRVLSGRETWRYAAFKIVIQFAAGILAGVLIYLTGIVLTDGVVANRAIDMQDAVAKLVPASTNVDAGGVWIFFLELVMTAVLLFPIFSPSVNDKFRFVIIFFIISMAVWGGIHGGSAALNPSRGLAQQIPGLFWGPAAGDATSMANIGGATGAMLAGTILAPVFYLFVQDLMVKFINPLVNKMIRYKDLSGETYVHIDQSLRAKKPAMTSKFKSMNRLTSKVRKNKAIIE